MPEDTNKSVLEYLDDKGLKPSVVEGGSEAQCNCCYCGKPGHLYVCLVEHEKGNRTRLPGFHKCMKCGKSGGLSALRRQLGDIPDIWQIGDKQGKQLDSLFLRGARESKSYKPAVVPPAGIDEEYHQALAAAYRGESDDKYARFALAYLTETRGIPWATLERWRVGFAWVEVGKGRRLRRLPFIAYPYYSVQGVLFNFKFRLIKAGDFGIEKEKLFMRWTGCDSIPYGLNLIKDSEGPAIVVEGEQDALALDAYGYANIISLPDGANSWDHKWTRWLANFEQIYICLDGDDTGQDAAIALSDKLGKLRCSNVLLPLKDGNDCLMAGIPSEQIQAAFDAAQPFPGGQIVEISDYEEQLVARLKGGERTTGTSTGYENLDMLLCGWREEELTIITGDTGMGKTTFTMSLAEKIATSGVNVLYCPFEMKPIQLMTKLVAMRAKREFMRLDEATVRQKVRELATEVPLYFLDAYGQIGIDPIIEVVQYAARYLGIGAFVLDPLQYALKDQGGPGERKEIIDAMHKLQGLVKSLAIRIIMVVHPTKLPQERKASRKVELDDLPGSASVKQDADNVLRLWAKPDSTGAITPHVEVTVLKARSEFARLGTATFQFNPDTLVYHEWETAHGKQAPQTQNADTHGWKTEELFDEKKR